MRAQYKKLDRNRRCCGCRRQIRSGELGFTASKVYIGAKRQKDLAVCALCLEKALEEVEWGMARLNAVEEDE